MSAKKEDKNGRKRVSWSIELPGIYAWVPLLSGEQSDNHIRRGPDEADN